MAERASVSFVLFKVRHFEFDMNLDIRNKAELNSRFAKDVLPSESFEFLAKLKELIIHSIHFLMDICALRWLRMINDVIDSR
jgi:hypothetical protein